MTYTIYHNHSLAYTKENNQGELIMPEPTYKPQDWIAFQQDDTGGFGTIIGGAYDGEQWYYTVQGSLVDGTLQSVREDEITLVLQNGSWLAPAHFGGQGSAYTES